MRFDALSADCERSALRKESARGARKEESEGRAKERRTDQATSLDRSVGGENTGGEAEEDGGLEEHVEIGRLAKECVCVCGGERERERACAVGVQVEEGGMGWEVLKRRWRSL